MLPSIKQLEIERQQLRKDLKNLHTMVTELCDRGQDKVIRYLDVRIKANNKQLEALNNEYEEYRAILQGKYPNAIRQEVDRTRNQKLATKKQIIELQKQIDTYKLSEPDDLMKEEYKIKTEMQSWRQKHTEKRQQQEKQERQLAQLQTNIIRAADRIRFLDRHLQDLMPQATTEDIQKYRKLQSKKQKLLNQLQRKQTLKTVEYDRKIARIDQVDLLSSDLLETEEQLDRRIEETRTELEQLQKKRRRASESKQVLEILQDYDYRLPRVQTEGRQVKGRTTKVQKRSSLLEEEYPQQYKELFLDLGNERQRKSRRSLGQKVRIGIPSKW